MSDKELIEERDQLLARIAELESGNESLRLVRDEYKRLTGEYRAKWLNAAVKTQPLPDRDAVIRKAVGLCNRIPGSTTWNAAEYAYDEFIEQLAALKQSSACVDERASFDEWFCKRHSYKPGTDTTQLSAAFEPFKAWQARAQLAAPAGVPAEWAKLDPAFVVMFLRQSSAFDADLIGEMLNYAISAAAQSIAPTCEPHHHDDVAVDLFAATMKRKLALARGKGRGGWDDKDQCSAEYLSRLLRGHVDKGDPVDVANFCMMLSQRGEGIAQASDVVPVPRATLEFWANDLALHGVADIESAQQIDALLNGGRS